jgi:hypothetical protein
MRRKKMQNTSAQSEGRLSTLMKRKESSDESSKSPGWTNAPASGTASQESTKEEPLQVTQEAIEAYERRTGFYGIGRIMVADGHWIIVTQEELARSRARMHANRHAILRQRGVA